MDNGDILIDARDIHSAHTQFWTQWFKGDESWSGLLASPWQPHAILTDFNLFLSCIHPHKIPTDTAHVIWRGLNSTSISQIDQDCIKHRVHADLTLSLQDPPTLLDLITAIKKLPSASAGGMSGLTYNQLKIWPESILSAAHQALSLIWKERRQTDFFKFKWLVPLSKLKEDGTPTLLQLRPIMLIETLRKLWVQLLIKRIRRTLEIQGALSNSQFGFRAKRSTTQPLLQFSSALEQVAEIGGVMAGSTWDVVRAFDSIAKPLLFLALIRIGIPDSWAEFLINLDQDSRIVTRSPWAENHVRKHGVQSLLNKSGSVPDFFHAERGVGQGDVGSPTIWNIFMDILLSSLQQVEFSPIYMQSMDGSCYRMRDTAYADDLITCSSNEYGLQTKADIVSAFSIVMKVSIAIHKLRSFTTLPFMEQQPSLIVHTNGWVPCSTPLRNEVDIEYLGVVFHISPNLVDPIYDKSFVKTYNKVRSFLHTIGRKRVHPNAKICAATISIFCKLAYVGQFVAWSSSQHDTIIKLFSKFYRRALLHLPSFPTRLLYANLSDMGLNLTHPSDSIQTRKWSILQRLGQGDRMSRDIANVLIGRAARLCRAPWGSSVPITISYNATAEYWLASLLLKLETAGISFTHQAAWCTDCIPLPMEVLSSEWAQHLNIYTVNDISFWDGQERILPFALQELTIYKKFSHRSMLPSGKKILNCPSFVVPTYTGLSIPILPNQCWVIPSMTENLIIAEILGQDDQDIHVHIWESFSKVDHPIHENQPLIRLRTSVQGGGSGMFLPISILEALSTRVILSSDALHPTFGIIRSILYSSVDKMHRPSRQRSPRYLPSELTAEIGSIPNPIIISDGSFTQIRTLSGEIGLDLHESKSGVGLVIMSQEENWKQLPSIGIYINTSEYLNSSFLAELFGLCLALSIRHDYLSDHVTALSDCKGAISLISNHKQVSGQAGEQLIKRSRQFVSPHSAPIWHPSHPERRGGPTCTRDYGILIADDYAGGNLTSCSLSFTLEASCLARIKFSGPTLIKGSLILADGLRSLFQRQFFDEYIETRRAASRQLYGSWVDPTTRLACLQWMLTSSSYRRIAMAQRYVWDKLTHPSHPSLDQPLDCPHCGTTSGIDHIVRHCLQPDMMRSRSQVDLELGTFIHGLHGNMKCQSICMTIENMSRRHKGAIRIWTGLWNRELSHDISQALLVNHILPADIRTHRQVILSFLRIFSQGLIHIWKSWRHYILPHSHSLIARFPRLTKRIIFNQTSMRAFTITAPSKQGQIRKDIIKQARSRDAHQRKVDGRLLDPAGKALISSWLLPNILATPYTMPLKLPVDAPATLPGNALRRWLIPSAPATVSSGLITQDKGTKTDNAHDGVTAQETDLIPTTDFISNSSSSSSSSSSLSPASTSLTPLSMHVITDMLVHELPPRAGIG